MDHAAHAGLSQSWLSPLGSWVKSLSESSRTSLPGASFVNFKMKKKISSLVCDNSYRNLKPDIELYQLVSALNYGALTQKMSYRIFNSSTIHITRYRNYNAVIIQSL